jgi:hypothetical protein
MVLPHGAESLKSLQTNVTIDLPVCIMAIPREYSASISGYLFHSILGHVVEPTLLRVQVPKKGFNVPGLPELNHSQVSAMSVSPP